MVVPPAPARFLANDHLSQVSCLFANAKGNKVTPGAIQRFPGIYLTEEINLENNLL